MRGKKLLLFLISCLLLSLIPEHHSLGESARSTEFEHLIVLQYYAPADFDGVSFSGFKSANLDIIDREDHIYYPNDLRAELNGYIIFSGSLVSDTAKILSITDSLNSFDDNGIDKVSVDYSTGFYLTQSGSTPERIQEGNVFTTSPNDLLRDWGPQTFFITVKDGDLITQHTIILDYYSPENSATLRSECDEILLYDATNGRSELLDDEYQYAKTRNYPSGVNGITLDEVGSNSIVKVSLPDEKYRVPEGVESVRISTDSQVDISQGGWAFAEDMDGIILKGTSEEKKAGSNSYWFYKNKTWSVKVNDEGWKEVDEGCVSPELKLKKGWNIIQVAHMAKDWIENPSRLAYHLVSNYPSKYTRIILLYKEEDSDYEISSNYDLGISSIRGYKAVNKWAAASGLFQDYPVYEKDNGTGDKERWIDLYSNSPMIWLKVVTTNQDVNVNIEGGSLVHGGFLLTLDPESCKRIPITLSTGTGEESNNNIEYLNINWTMSSTELQKLYPVKGGTFTHSYNVDDKLYYLKKNGSSEITLAYQGNSNTETAVYLEGKLVETVDDDRSHSITIPATSHNLQFRITAQNGAESIYTVVVERTDNDGISEGSKHRAKDMIDKIVDGGFVDQLRENQPVDAYWSTFMAASLGKNYLESTLATDVTGYSYTQATSYAATILQLIMSGENPYNYLGVNYVEKLVSLGPGYYGPYGNNIWTLLALDAAGYPEDKTLVNNVSKQVYDETFDLDMRGWGLAALSNHLQDDNVKEKVDCAVETIKKVQLTTPMEKMGYEVTGAFENFWYTNQNINTHGCVVSGLTSLGIDVGSSEWQTPGLTGIVDGISLFESYQDASGKFIRTPDDLSFNFEWSNEYNKDAIIAIGDIYNGSSVWQRYSLTNERYNELVSEAERLLSTDIEDIDLKKELEASYDDARQYVSSEPGISSHGKEFYDLQSIVYTLNGNKPDVFQGTAVERKQVRDLVDRINKLPSDADVSYENREAILAAEEAYELLQGDERLEHYVTNYGKLEKTYAYIHDIDVFLDAMKKIKKVDLSKAAKVKAAREAYDFLSDKQKTEDVVTSKYEELLTAEEIIEACRTAENVIAVIDTLGQVTILDSRESIEGARASYEALDETQKQHVTNYERLVAAEEELQRLEALEEDKNQAADVDKLINKIGSVNHNSGAAIMSAEEAYQALEREEAKRLVCGFPYLTECRRIYDNLIWNEERQHAADQVDYYISRIEDSFGGGEFEVTPGNETEVRSAVITARDYYDALVTGEDPDVASYVAGYNSLLHAEALLEFYDWQQAGTEFSSQDFKDNVSSLTAPAGLESEGKILIAFAMYDALSEAGLLDEEALNLYQALCSRREEQEYFQEQYSKVQEMVQKILSLGTIGLGSASDINETCEEYNSLDTAQQALIDPAYVKTLEQTVEQYDALAQENNDADRVERLIDDIGEPDLNVEDKIQEARQEYDALEDKSRVSNYLVLVNAEYRILELKKEAEDYPIASTVIERIKELGIVQLDDAYKVTSARDAYEALTATQKKCVKNLADLGAAEARIDALNKASVSLNFQNKEIHIGEYVVIRVVTSVAKANLTWRCSDSSVISLDEKTGKLTGLKAGQAFVTVTLDNGNQASCKVIVTKAASSEVDKETPSISLSRKKATLYTKGSGKTVTLILKYNGKKVTGNKVRWKSSKPSIARVSDKGKVTAKKKGTVIIKATYKGKTYTCKVTVKDHVLKIDRKKLSLSLRKKRQYSFKVWENGKCISSEKVKWSSNNKRIVIVSSSGRVVAKKIGTAKITAKLHGKKVVIKVRVKK